MRLTLVQVCEVEMGPAESARKTIHTVQAGGPKKDLFEPLRNCGENNPTVHIRITDSGSKDRVPPLTFYYLFTLLSS